MIDQAKVLVGLKSCADSTGALCRTCPYDFVHNENCMGDMARDALELLKEQEAKPVIVTTNAYGTRFYHCPKCSRDLYAYPRQLYCSNCGQAVKWE